ncbi:hypothetical protein K1T71_008574 [Dendrolimus kikuchii]|uniref:Uncharacterized protein n=1 Tax=Dendrolimus kikuchii TaxID=765133 RepID=A0ACC1CVC5_9NEOP|nr:hypothetical protein K1T71_008574 [Dendrolimus kikuchii]
MLISCATCVLVVVIIIIIIRLLLVRSIRMCKCSVTMTGRLVIVTGGNAGIGYCTALELARRGARVILACRNNKRGKAACDSIIAATGNKDVSYSDLDLSSLTSVRNFAMNIHNTESKLDVLVNNAGVNYFGHFLLTLLLLPLLKQSQSGRIVNLSSVMHFLGDINLENINKIGQSNIKMITYANSKLCSLIFSVELSRRLEGTRVTANAVHPGVIWTGIMWSETFKLQSALFAMWCWVYNRTAEQGAQTVVHVCVSEECSRVSGKYFVDCAERVTLPKVRNEIVAKQLWDYSEKLVEFVYDDST